ncbi:MAG: phosphoribosylformylglycinamidine synthase subunit PurS [Actinomycetota bacterium]|nr:phosphoribosylformylglycinamidine synthase subunit PurS [Actinomycetota bacterium]
MPRSEISDPQGQAVKRALPGIGFQGFSDVRIGKRIRLVLDAPSEEEARAQVEAACERILANPVIEEFEVEHVRPVEGTVTSE